MSLNQIGDFHFKSRILNLFEVARVALSLGKYTNALKMSKDIWITRIIQLRHSHIKGITTLRLKIFKISFFQDFTRSLNHFDVPLIVIKYPLAYLRSSFEAQWRRRVQQFFLFTYLASMRNKQTTKATYKLDVRKWELRLPSWTNFVGQMGDHSMLFMELHK